MDKNAIVIKSKYTLVRVFLFCLSCAIILAISSRLAQGIPKRWSQQVLVFIAAAVTFGCTMLFVRMEGLRLKDVGVVPNRSSIARFFAGFLSGFILAALQAVFLLVFGLVKLSINPVLDPGYFLTGLLLYMLIAFREELAFRAYPLRVLSYKLGTLRAQLIVAMIFIAEHIAGGMSWLQAILGAGTGAVLYGLVALMTRGIAASTGIHAAWNFTQWCEGFKNEPGIWRTAVEKGNELKVEQMGFIFYLVIMWCAISIVYYYPIENN